MRLWGVAGLDIFALDAADWDVDQRWIRDKVVRLIVMLADDLMADASTNIGSVKIGAEQKSLNLFRRNA